MDLHKVKAEEIRGWEAARRREATFEIKKALADIRMDIYTAKSQHGAKVRGLRRALARIATVETELGKKAAQVAKKA